VEAPLGPFARPGVPIPLASDAERDAALDGLRIRLRAGVTLVAAPRVPCELRDARGEPLLRLLPAPSDALLVGVVGPHPADLAARIGGPVRVVALEAAALVEAWPCYDLFDRVYVSDASVPERARAALVAWARAGGSLASVGDPNAWRGAGDGLGSFYAGRDLIGLLAASGAVEPLRAPRAGNVRPDVYALWPGAEVSAEPIRAGRRALLAASAALAGTLLVGALGRADPRLLLAAILAVALLGSALGLVLSGRAYDPVARGRVELSFEGAGSWRRVRVFRFEEALGAGAPASLREGEIPLLFAAGGTSLDSAPRPGELRAFFRDELRPPAGAEGVPAPIPDLLEIRGVAGTAAFATAARPSNRPGTEPILLSVRVGR